MPKTMSPTASAARHRRYSFLPADVVGDEFGKLEQMAAAGGDTRVQEHLQYVRRG